jgi:hypothetical protein
VDVEALALGCPIATTRYAAHHELLPADTPVCDSCDDDDKRSGAAMWSGQPQ